MTIDLNGHSITSSGDYVFKLKEGVTLTLIDNSSGSSKGSVICSFIGGGIAINLLSNSKLIADGINITSAYGFAIYVDVATAEITNCNVSGPVGIYNDGTLTINGGSISGSDIVIQNDGGTIAVNTGENPAACTISGGYVGISNGRTGTITLGSGVTIKDYTQSGINNFGGTVTLNAWPTFSPADNATGSDISLIQGEKIAIGADITAAPTKKISVQVVDIVAADITGDVLPYTFTSGYAAHVKSDATTVIDPAEVFTYSGSTAGIAVEFGTGDDSGEAALVKSATIPNSIVLDTDILPTYIGDSGPEWTFTMPDYDVTVEVVYVDADDEVTFDFAENQEWMTWCSHKSYAKPAGVSAYTISAVTPTEVTLSEISASDGGGTAVLPAYTPLLLKKEGTGSQSIAAEATDGDTGTGIADAKGVVTQSVSGATVFGSTASLDATAFRDYLDTGSTYMLKSGTFILIDTNAGMAANRCWLTLNGTAGARSLRIGRGVSTDISGVKELSPAGDDAWYTLTGRKMDQRPRTSGVYIHGGKKIIVK